jgi:hypothetical protein
MEEACGAFYEVYERVNGEMDGLGELQRRIVSRLGFYGRRWKGTATYAETTMQRLEVQRSAVSDFIPGSFECEANKRDSCIILWHRMRVN